MSFQTGLFQLDLYQIDEATPAQATLATDPIGQVVAVIWAYLPEGFGSELYAWQETAYLRAEFAREKVELVRAIEGEYSIEGEWDLDVHDDDAREYLLLTGGEVPDGNAFATLAACASDLKITPPPPELRAEWDERPFRKGVSDEDWPGPGPGEHEQSGSE
ncbi:hypothetical protein [Actinomycetospora chiangmaiensis]|uniref:hypothetical protein n=1 Tax=Actinomycetospora chiangmaiensis TaxID=402650 RepID=UPI00036B857D|nr:hypothetical protein [Actinomycetospora chiangmaiensis]